MYFGSRFLNRTTYMYVDESVKLQFPRVSTRELHQFFTKPHYTEVELPCCISAWVDRSAPVTRLASAQPYLCDALLGGLLQIIYPDPECKFTFFLLVKDTITWGGISYWFVDLT